MREREREIKNRQQQQQLQLQLQNEAKPNEAKDHNIRPNKRVVYYRVQLHHHSHHPQQQQQRRQVEFGFFVAFVRLLV